MKARTVSRVENGVQPTEVSRKRDEHGALLLLACRAPEHQPQPVFVMAADQWRRKGVSAVRRERLEFQSRVRFGQREE
jgi:hypothetical protein